MVDHTFCFKGGISIGEAVLTHIGNGQFQGFGKGLSIQCGGDGHSHITILERAEGVIFLINFNNSFHIGFITDGCLGNGNALTVSVDQFKLQLL